jgi:hypothetical protein
MRGSNRFARSLLYLLCGAGFVLPSSLLLLFIYGMCLMNPARPDYYAAKTRMMFSFPDPGALTWPAVGGVLLGICIAVGGGLRALLRNREGKQE